MLDGSVFLFNYMCFMVADAIYDGGNIFITMRVIDGGIISK